MSQISSWCIEWSQCGRYSDRLQIETYNVTYNVIVTSSRLLMAICRGGGCDFEVCASSQLHFEVISGDFKFLLNQFPFAFASSHNSGSTFLQPTDSVLSTNADLCDLLAFKKLEAIPISWILSKLNQINTRDSQVDTIDGNPKSLSEESFAKCKWIGERSCLD